MPSLLRIDSSPCGDGKESNSCFAYSAQGYVGNSDLSSMNFFELHLVELLKFIGIEDIAVFRLEGTSVLDGESLSKQKYVSQTQVKNTQEVN